MSLYSQGGHTTGGSILRDAPRSLKGKLLQVLPQGIPIEGGRPRGDKTGACGHHESGEGTEMVGRGAGPSTTFRSCSQVPLFVMSTTSTSQAMYILLFEDSYLDVLQDVAESLWPGAEIEALEVYEDVPLDLALEFEDLDLVITDMMMPTGLKSRDLDYAGVPVMIWAKENGVPALCISSLDHHDEEVNFGNHVLRQAGMEMIDEVEKSEVESWKTALREHWSEEKYWSVPPPDEINPFG